jgi:hypothetical protein
MPISLQEFRDKVQAGDAERLEVNRAGTGLHRKGMSAGGRAVEWLRDAVGARKTENRALMRAFVAALKAEHGDLIGGKAETVLQGHESKPLSSRQVRVLISDADTLRTSMRRKNEALAQLYAPGQQNDRALGYMSAVAAAKKAMGASDALVEELFDYGPESETTGVRDAIRQAIEAAGQDGKRVVSNDEARAIAQQKVSEFMGRRMGHEVTLNQPLAAAGPAVEILEQVKGLRAQRLNARVGGSAGADPMVEQQLMRDMGAQIGKLDNTKLLKLYRTTLSADMVEVRLALANRQNDPKAQLLLEDLNSYEGMVHMEVIERSLQQQAPEVDDFQVIDHGPKSGQLAALAATEKRAAQRELAFQSDSYLGGQDTHRAEHPGAAAKLANTGVTTAQVVAALRSADLTINVGLKLFAKGGGFRDQSGKLVTGGPRVKNIYELPQTKGPLYLDRRKAVEYALEPATERADRSGSNIDPSDHPNSAGVNVGRRIDGAAWGYGEVVLVLKDSVKDRCTFTPIDSFKAFEARVTRDNIDRYKAKVAEMLKPGGGLREEDRKALTDDPTKLNAMFAALDQMEGQEYGAGRPFLVAIQNAVREVDPQEAGWLNYQFTNAAIDVFRNRPGAGGHVTTSERMSHIIADLNKDVLDQVVAGVQDYQRINLPVNDYIEAQVYGEVNLASDVAEIRYCAQNTNTMMPQQKQAYLDSMQGLRQMADELGVRVVQYQEADKALTHL